MKLDSQQIDYIHTLIGVAPMPDEHPVVEELKAAFGPHTFYLSDEGLVIWEWLDGPDAEGQPVVAIIVAGWADDDRTSLTMHEPRATDVVIPLVPSPQASDG